MKRKLIHVAEMGIMFMLGSIFGATMFSASARAADIPPNAHQYLPLVAELQQQYWPDAPLPGLIAAQIHKESCIHAKHPKCWNAKAQLKTEREWGVGMGQCTIAYNKDGSERFNCFRELQKLHADLRKWDWQRDMFNPRMQIAGMILMDKSISRRIIGAANEWEHTGFWLSGYNGGEGHLLRDRRLCDATPGCDSHYWYGHVEKYSVKSRAKWKGYGESPYDINRGYPRKIMKELRPLYVKYF